MSDAEVKVWFRIRRDDRSLSLKDVFEKMEEIRRKVPDEEVYFDGDEFAICSRPLRRSPSSGEPSHTRSRPSEGPEKKRRGRQTRLT
ncbi:MAG: hypothetical protein QW379_05795 [Thermoplasmata archaeon]